MDTISVSKNPSNNSIVALAQLIKTFGALLIANNPVFKELYDEYKTRLSARDPARSEARLQAGAARFCVKAFLDYFQEGRSRVLYDRSTVDKIKQNGRIVYNPFLLAKIIKKVDARRVRQHFLATLSSPPSLWVDDEKKIAES